MRRSRTGEVRDSIGSRPFIGTCQESRWDPTKYDPARVYGELAELFEGLRKQLGPHLGQYLLMVKQYVKQSLSVCELDKRVEKLLNGDSLSIHDTFIQVLSESCRLITISRSMSDILAGNVKSESQKDYIPHISTINALLILRSLENGWGAPDPTAGQFIGDAVRTMLADRIDAAIHVRKSPNTNKIGFRSSFNPSSVQLGNPFHQITVTDLFNSFAVQNHFLGAETRNLLRLKCHSDFYEKLKFATEGGCEENTGNPSTSRTTNLSSVVVEEEIVLNESFCNLATAGAHTCISLPVTICLSPKLSGSFPETEFKTVHLPNEITLPVRASREDDFKLRHGLTLPSIDTESSSSYIASTDHLDVNVSSVTESLLKLKGRSVKRRRENILDKSTVSDVADPTVTPLQSSNKSARLEVIESSSELPHSSREYYSNITDSLSSKCRKKKEELQHSNSKLICSPLSIKRLSPKKERALRNDELKHKVDMLLDDELDMDELSKSLRKDWPRIHKKKESKWKSESGNFPTQTASMSRELKTASIELGKNAVFRTKSGSSGATDKDAVQRAQAIIDAWKSSSYEVVPTYVGEQVRFENEKHIKGFRTKALSSALPMYYDDKDRELIALGKAPSNTTAAKKESTVLGAPLDCSRESARKARKYNSSVCPSFENSSALQNVMKAGVCSHSPSREGKMEAAMTSFVKRSKAGNEFSTGSGGKTADFCSDNASTPISTPTSSQEQKLQMSSPEQLKRRKTSIKFSAPLSVNQESDMQKSGQMDIPKKESLRKVSGPTVCSTTHVQKSTALHKSSSKIEKESKPSLDSNPISEKNKEKEPEQVSKSGLSKSRRIRLNRQQRDEHVKEAADGCQQSCSLEKHVSEEVSSKMVSKRIPKNKNDITRTTLTLLSSSQSSVDDELQYSTVIMKGKRIKSRGNQGGAIAKTSTITLRSSSQSSVDTKLQSSTDRRRSCGSQGGAGVKATTLASNSSSQSSVDVESQSATVTDKGNRTRSFRGQGGAVTKENYPKKLMIGQRGAQKTRDSIPLKVSTTNDVLGGSASRRSSQRRRGQASD